MITSDEIIISVMHIASTKYTNTIATNVTSTVSIMCHSKKLRYQTDCYILLTILLVIILLLTINIICYHYAEQKVIKDITT